MILSSLTSKTTTLFLIEPTQIVTILIITVCFFLVLLILGVRKSYKLKAENERLSKEMSTPDDDEDKPYTDFTEGHLY
jgi:hypothetical protein